MLEITPNTALTELFLSAIRVQFDAVTGHRFFTRFKDEATLAQMRRGLLGFYGMIEIFPRLMSTILARIDPHERAGAAEARDWFIRNISLEERHREWWIDTGGALGLSERDFGRYRASAAMEAHRHYLYYVVHAGSIGEAVAAVNYAVEGATGIWTRQLRTSARARFQTLGIEFTPQTLRWFDVHAEYDDKHPMEALEIVKLYCPDEPSMTRAADAAARSLEFYAMALDDALRA